MTIGTGNIKLSDVTTEIYGDTNAGRSLLGCFATAAGTFNNSYVGNKDRLSNFKGYDKRVYDQQGNAYGAVKIGTQVWMNKNLQCTILRDGTSIPGVGPQVDWRDANVGIAWCQYNNEGDQGYGLLYNWFAVQTGKLAPYGWHVPSKAEFDTLSAYLDENSSYIKEIGTTHWIEDRGNNLTGFNAFGSGFRSGNSILEDFYGLKLGFWAWSTTLNASNHAYFLRAYYPEFDTILIDVAIPHSGLSVRCIRNNYVETVTLAPTSVQYFQAALRGVSDGGQDGTVNSRGVCISTSPNPTTAGTKTTNSAGGNGEYSDVLTGLSPSTGYNVRAWCNVSGTTYYGENKVFTTLSTINVGAGIFYTGYMSLYIEAFIQQVTGTISDMYIIYSYNTNNPQPSDVDTGNAFLDYGVGYGYNTLTSSDIQVDTDQGGTLYYTVFAVNEYEPEETADN